MINPTTPAPIQPFVPVCPDGRTALYSHRELRALASMDPRNELDELSEPLRFKKALHRPCGCPDASRPRGPSQDRIQEASCA